MCWTCTTTFSWRWSVNQGTSADADLKTKPDDWLKWYFDAQGNIKTAQLKFWMPGYGLNGDPHSSGVDKEMKDNGKS